MAPIAPLVETNHLVDFKKMLALISQMAEMSTSTAELKWMHHLQQGGDYKI